MEVYYMFTLGFDVSKNTLDGALVNRSGQVVDRYAITNVHLVPTQFVRSTLTRFAARLRGRPVFSASKGLERGTLARPTEIIAELRPWFTIERRSHFPLPFLPFVFCNLVIGYVLQPRP